MPFINKTFTEKQRFNQWWLWVLLMGALAFTAISNVRRNPDFKSTAGLLVWLDTLIVILLVVFFRIMKLETRITEEGIYYRFKPVHGKERFFPWSQIEKAYVRQYNPLLEYGGWGIRIRPLQKSGAFNIAGNMGIQLELKNGRKILLGTQKPEEAGEVLYELEKAGIYQPSATTP